MIPIMTHMKCCSAHDCRHGICERIVEVDVHFSSRVHRALSSSVQRMLAYEIERIQELGLSNELHAFMCPSNERMYDSKFFRSRTTTVVLLSCADTIVFEAVTGKGIILRNLWFLGRYVDRSAQSRHLCAAFFVRVKV